MYNFNLCFDFLNYSVGEIELNISQTPIYQQILVKLKCFGEIDLSWVKSCLFEIWQTNIFPMSFKCHFAIKNLYLLLTKLE